MDDFSCSCDLGWADATCSSCAPGHTGADCATCLPGYYDDGGICRVDPLEQVCGGTTTGADWVAYDAISPTSVWRDNSTSSCSFASTPLYFTSLRKQQTSWNTGVTAIYSPTASGFRTYISNDPMVDAIGFSVDADDMNTNDWQMDWIGVPNGILSDRLCTGRTVDTSWQVHDANTIKVTVDISACNFPSTGDVPVIVTSIGAPPATG